LYFRPDMAALCEGVHGRGGIVFMDCAQIDVTLDTPGVVDALRMVDVFAPNETEALQLTGTDTIDDALDVLAALTPLIVLKQGPKGATARRGDHSVHVPALDGLDIVDTTGAGDCFNAGFLHAFLRGEELERCLQLGNIVGGLSTGARGTQNVPTLAQARAHLAAYQAH